MTKRIALIFAGFAIMLSCQPAESGDAIITAAAASARDSIRRDSLARAQQDSLNRTLSGYVVDSILPIEEQLRRFRAAAGGEFATRFAGGATSRNELVSRFVTAVERGDSTALRSMMINAREFADLVFPESPYIKAPYRQDPSLVWRTIQNPSESGFRRLIRRVSGVPMNYKGYRCEGPPIRQGRNRLWGNCVLKLAELKGKVVEHRYFGSIVEREGHFKFLGFKNEF